MKKLASWLLIAVLCVIASAIASRAQIVNRVVDQIIATTCTNQFVRSIVASGTATCASIAAADMPALTGDTTSSAGSLITTTTKINGVDQTTAWSTTSPTPTCGGTAGSVAFGTTNVRTKTNGGKAIRVAVTLAITTNSTCSVNVQLAMPFTVVSATGSCILAGRANGVSGKAIVGNIAAGGTGLVITNYDNTYPGANGERLDLSGECETT